MGGAVRRGGGRGLAAFRVFHGALRGREKYPLELEESLNLQSLRKKIGRWREECSPEFTVEDQEFLQSFSDADEDGFGSFEEGFV